MNRNSLITDARKFPAGWRLWFWVLVLVNVAGPLFFIDRLEAQLTLGAYVVAGLIIVPMHRRLGWVRLLGVGHLPWLALLPWLLGRYLDTDPAGAFGAWLLAVLVVDTACLVIDVVDIVRYARGEREPLVARPGTDKRQGEAEPLTVVWERLTPIVRSRLVWSLWFVTWLLLLAGLAERDFYVWTVWFSAAHALFFLALFALRLRPFPVQVRLAYLLWVAVGTWVPGMVVLMYVTTLGLVGNLFFGYCPLARIMSLMPWNRKEPLSVDLLRRTFFSPPSCGPFTPQP